MEMKHMRPDASIRHKRASLRMRTSWNVLSHATNATCLRLTVRGAAKLLGRYEEFNPAQYGKHYIWQEETWPVGRYMLHPPLLKPQSL